MCAHCMVETCEEFVAVQVGGEDSNSKVKSERQGKRLAKSSHDPKYKRQQGGHS